MKLSNSTLPPFPLLTTTIMISIKNNNQELKPKFVEGYRWYMLRHRAQKLFRLRNRRR
jgi:hypothetical protein